jgi:hypothetical protein
MNATEANTLLGYLEGNWQATKAMTEEEASAWLMVLCVDDMSQAFAAAILRDLVEKPADTYNATRRPNPSQFLVRATSERRRKAAIENRTSLALVGPGDYADMTRRNVAAIFAANPRLRRAKSA